MSGWEDWLWIVSDEVLEFDMFLLVVCVFDVFDFGVLLCFMYEVFGGIWEVLCDGCVDLVVGVINELLVILGFKWFEFGVMEWVFVVLLCYLLGVVSGVLMCDVIGVYCVVVVVDLLWWVGCVYGLFGG